MSITSKVVRQSVADFKAGFPVPCGAPRIVVVIVRVAHSHPSLRQTATASANSTTGSIRSAPTSWRMTKKVGERRPCSNQLGYVRSKSARPPNSSWLSPLSNPLKLQQRLFTAALVQIAEDGEPVNQVLEVDLQNEEVVISLYDLPTPLPPPDKTG